MRHQSSVYTRFIADLILVILVFMLPWWVSFLTALVALWLFPFFIEILVLGIVIDSLYNAPIGHIKGFQFVITFVALVAFMIAQFLKSRIRQ